MGDSSSGKVIIGIIAYFFVFYVVVIACIYIFNFGGIDTTDISTTDPGFQNRLTPYNSGGECGGSLPFESRGCGFLSDFGEEVCESVATCTWYGLGNISLGCGGYVDYSEWGGGCSSGMNQSFCKLVGCTWTDYNSGSGSSFGSTENIDMSTIKSLGGIVTGFSAELGIPSGYKFMYQFTFLYLPFIIFLIALYFALPVIH